MQNGCCVMPAFYSNEAIHQSKVLDDNWQILFPGSYPAGVYSYPTSSKKHKEIKVAPVCL